jgi:hypothetical protein
MRLRFSALRFYWADGIGVGEVYRQIQAWHQQYGERWAPAALLRRLAEAGTPFSRGQARQADVMTIRRIRTAP